jgi:N-acyl homoserine lactone hydrolase
MGVTAETRPAQLPLPGGTRDATVRVHPLLAGELHSPPGMLDRPSGRLVKLRGLEVGRSRANWIWLPVPAFLVEHPGAGAMLVDTGLHPSVAIDPVQSVGRLGKLVYEFRMEPEQALHAQLRARGVDPASVGVVVMTHLHGDHASGVSEFPDATFVLDRREWESAIRPRGTFRGYHTKQFDYGFDWRTVDYGATEIDSFATFGGSVDLFGDGSVRLLSTPGHTLGHQSVLLRLRDRDMLVCGDAAYLRRTIDDGVQPLIAHDEHLFRRSLKEIQRFVSQSPGLVVVPGHDADAWANLGPVYE